MNGVYTLNDENGNPRVRRRARSVFGLVARQDDDAWGRGARLLRAAPPRIIPWSRPAERFRSLTGVCPAATVTDAGETPAVREEGVKL
jgi:hypothetical protein